MSISLLSFISYNQPRRPHFPKRRRIVAYVSILLAALHGVGAAWEFMDAGLGPFSNTRGPLAGTLQGHFATNYLNFVALNVAWKV